MPARHYKCDTCRYLYSKDAPCGFCGPKDWDGDIPEGTRLATDFVVGQRVRTLTTVIGTIRSLTGCVAVLNVKRGTHQVLTGHMRGC